MVVIYASLYSYVIPKLSNKPILMLQLFLFLLKPINVNPSPQHLAMHSILQSHWSGSQWSGGAEALAQDVTKWKHTERNQQQYSEDGKWPRGNVQPLSNYTSVHAVVNEGEQCTGIALMGKALMRILWTPNPPCSEYFSSPLISRAASSMFSNVKGRCFQILEGVLCMPSTKFPQFPYKPVGDCDKQVFWKASTYSKYREAAWRLSAALACAVMWRRPSVWLSVFPVVLQYWLQHNQNKLQTPRRPMLTAWS